MATKTNTTADQPKEQLWYVDSGANNHVTTTLKNLTLQKPFRDEEEVAMENGTCFPISNTSSSTLFHSKNSFKINNILHCPTTAANHISI